MTCTQPATHMRLQQSAKDMIWSIPDPIQIVFLFK